MTIKNKLDTIDHIAIQVESIKKSVKWYLENFDCKLIYADKTWGFLQFKNTKLALVTKIDHPPHFAILDNNVESNSKAVTHRDGSVSFYIKDLDSNYIELIKYKDE